MDWADVRSLLADGRVDEREIVARAGRIDRATDAAARPMLELAVRCMDLTTLRGTDTPEDVRALCERAVRPGPGVGPVAAVCVYPQLAPIAVARLRGTGVLVASVAGGFPAGLTPLEARVLEIRHAVACGVDEVDVVLNRSLVRSGNLDRAREELAAEREAAGDRTLKVILETGELKRLDLVRSASLVAMAAGADFLKTSTGTIAAGASLPAAVCMLDAIAAFAAATGRRVGFKAAGGIRSPRAALSYLVATREVLGADCLTPDRVRLGASSLLDALVGALTGAG